MKTNKNNTRLSYSANRKNIINPNMKFEIVEAYKTARTNLMFSLAATKNKTIVCTSYSPNEGKSTTCVNMALTLAQTGANVLIIDADMRKPSVHNLLHISHTMGLSTVLGKFCELQPAIKRSVAPNLDVMIAGAIPPNPAELLASPQMAEILQQLEAFYEYILIDTPPIGVVSDALLLSQSIAGFIFVVRESVTTHGELSKGLQDVKLADGKVLGFIKAGCNIKRSVYYKKNHYEYYQ